MFIDSRNKRTLLEVLLPHEDKNSEDHLSDKFRATVCQVSGTVLCTVVPKTSKIVHALKELITTNQRRGGRGCPAHHGPAEKQERRRCFSWVMRESGESPRKAESSEDT